MNDQISVTLIANAGLLIQDKKYRFLIDAFHHDEGQPFSIVSKEKLNQMINGSEEYKDVDYILYTHCHSDHFSSKYTKAYLEQNQINTLFIPNGWETNDHDFESYLLEKGIHEVNFCGDLGELIPYMVKEELKIQAFKSLHLGEAYQEDPHYCVILSLGDFNILITGDANYDPETFKSALNGIRIHTIVVNPLFYNHKLGRQIIYDLIKPDEIIIYHIPFEKDDVYKLRRLTKRDIDKHHGEHHSVTALTEENQTIVLNNGEYK